MSIINTILPKDEMIEFNQTIFSPQIETFVPFAESVDASRLNMASKQQLQPTVSKYTEVPFMLDKNYQKMTTVNSPFMEIAQDDGFIIYNSNELIVFYYKNQKKLITRYLPAYKKLVNISLSKKYIRPEKKFNKGDILWDYTNMDIETKIPKIGYRARIAYMQFFGYSADDAVIISESFARKAQMEYSMKLYIPITKQWKYFKSEYHDDYIPKVGTKVSEEIIWYNKIDTSKHFTSEIINFTDEKSKFFTKYIDGIDNAIVTNVKVHFPKEVNLDYIKDQDEKYIYNLGLWGEIKEIYENQLEELEKLKKDFKIIGMAEDKIDEYLNNQIKTQYMFLEKIPKHFNDMLSETYNLTSKDIDALIEIDLGYDAVTTRGDKFTNLFAGKATAAMIIPDEYMPYDEEGNKIDMLFNTLGIPGRNNWGTIFESAVAKVIVDIEKTAKEKNVNLIKEKLDFINKNFIIKYDKEYHDQVNDLINNFDKLGSDFIKDVNKKGFYLFVSNFTRMEYKRLYLTFLEPYANKFGINFNKETVTIPEKCVEWLRDKWQFKKPFNYKKEIKVQAQVSYNYLLKLHHSSFSKYNAVDFTTSYSKITGQPSRGRKKNGGQHISWQSLAAFLAHKEDNAVLKELYTIKSDAINEKELFILSYIKNNKYYLKNKYDSVTKKTINNSLKVFGLKFQDD